MLQESLHTRTLIYKHEKTYFVRAQDLRSPVSVARDNVHAITRARNRGVLEVRHSLAQRTNIRINVDCLTRVGNRTTYKRLAQLAAILSCPTPEQAELAIEAILSFAQSLDGKWLAPAEPTQAVDTQAQEQSAGDSQAIGTASAPGEPEPTAAASSESMQDDEAQGFSGS
jgi:hypothetical protein